MRRTVLMLVATLGLSALACGFLEKKSDIPYETEIPVEFTIDASELCDPSQDYIEDCDSQDYRESPESFQLDRVEEDLDIDVVERTGREELREASGRFKEITITSIEYEVAPNSLSFATPEIDLFLGPKPAESRDDDDVFKLTTLPSVDPQKEKSGEATVSSAAQSSASSLFKKLELSAIPSGRPEIQKGDDIPPHGKADVELTLHVKFVANPADAATK